MNDLAQACIDDNIEWVDKLIQDGVDVTEDYNFALKCAVNMSSLEIVKKLIDAGADINDDGVALRIWTNPTAGYSEYTVVKKYKKLGDPVRSYFEMISRKKKIEWLNV